MSSTPVVNSSNVLYNTTEIVRPFSGNVGNTPDCHVEGAVIIKVSVLTILDDLWYLLGKYLNATSN
jgi:hypothetical protein